MAYSRSGNALANLSLQNQWRLQSLCKVWQTTLLASPPGLYSGRLLMQNPDIPIKSRLKSSQRCKQSRDKSGFLCFKHFAGLLTMWSEGQINALWGWDLDTSPGGRNLQASPLKWPTDGKGGHPQLYFCKTTYLCNLTHGVSVSDYILKNTLPGDEIAALKSTVGQYWKTFAAVCQRWLSETPAKLSLSIAQWQ